MERRNLCVVMASWRFAHFIVCGTTYCELCVFLVVVLVSILLVFQWCCERSARVSFRKSHAEMLRAALHNWIQLQREPMLFCTRSLRGAKCLALKLALKTLL